MQRVTHSTKATDLFGIGKHGYTAGEPGVTPATVLEAARVNELQEEICSVIEAAGATVDGGSNHQMRDAINTLIGNQAGATSVLSETQAAQSLRLAFSTPGKFPRDMAIKTGAQGSLAGVLLVGDSGYLATRVLGGALTNRTPGSGFSGNFTACCTDAGGTYVAVGDAAEVQTSADGQTFTRRNSGGANQLYWVTSDGTKVLTGGAGGALYLASTATGTYSAVTSPAGSTALSSGLYANGLWVITTSDGRVYTSPSAAAGTWTLRLTVTLSPSFLQGRLSYGALGWSAMFTHNAGRIGHAYSTDGTTWQQSLSVTGTINHGDPSNVWNTVLDHSYVVIDNTSPAVSFLTIGVFANLNSTPILTGDCRTLYGVLQDNCLPFRLKRLNDQIVLLAHDAPGGTPTNGFVYMSAPIRNK